MARSLPGLVDQNPLGGRSVPLGKLADAIQVGKGFLNQVALPCCVSRFFGRERVATRSSPAAETTTARDLSDVSGIESGLSDSVMAL